MQEASKGWDNDLSTKYIKELLKKFDMYNAKTIDNPIEIATWLDKDEPGPLVEEKKYWAVIRSLLYLTTSKPDIVFRVGLCARFQYYPKDSHMKIVLGDT